MNLVSVICPTISARTHWVERVEHVYDKTIPDDYDWEFLLIEDQPTCGLAWRAGIKEAQGEYIHLTADDIEPWPGWLEAAVEVAEAGNIVTGPILSNDGALQSAGQFWMPAEEPEAGAVMTMTRIPFATAEQFARIGPMLPTHYYTDNWFSFRANECAMEIQYAPDYRFTHHFAAEGRLEWRMASDKNAYDKYHAGALRP